MSLDYRKFKPLQDEVIKLRDENEKLKQKIKMLITALNKADEILSLIKTKIK